MNSLNLRQVCGGDTIKQADFGSELAFELLDEQYVKFRESLADSAKVILKKDNTAIYQKSVPITQNTVSFKFDKILPVGSYVLEIIVGDYVFPSNNRVIITVEQTYGDFEPEYLVKVSYEELKADVDDVKTKIEQFENTLNANETNVNQELLAINQNASDMNKRIESLENREDKDTIYNDTEIKQSVADVDTKVDNLSEKVTALEERPIVDTALTERVEALEAKEDKDTVYDDSNLKAKIAELESKLQSLNIIKRPPYGYRLNRKANPWELIFDNGCILTFPLDTIHNYYAWDESPIKINTRPNKVYAYSTPEVIMWHVKGHYTVDKIKEDPASNYNEYINYEIKNPINDSSLYNFDNAFGDATNLIGKRNFVKLLYELDALIEDDLLSVGVTKKEDK